MSNVLELGKWNVMCDRCQKKRKSDEVTKTWDNLIVCKPSVREGCFEERHPQDFVRAVKDQEPIPYARPEAPDQFVTPTYVSSSVGTQENTKPSGTFNTNTL